MDLRFPIDGAFRIGYGFGPRGDIGVPGASTNHEGIDIVRPDGPLPVGTPVHAILDGKVLISTTSGGAGSTILTEHYNWYGATYRIRSNHFSRRLVKAGQRITRGQVIGESGGEPGTPGAGSSGGPHYHCGVYKIVNGRAVAIDPGPFFGLGSTLGIGTTRPGVTFPAFAGGDSNPFTPPVQEEEEDDMPLHTVHARADKLNGTHDGDWTLSDPTAGLDLAPFTYPYKPAEVRRKVYDDGDGGIVNEYRGFYATNSKAVFLAWARTWAKGGSQIHSVTARDDYQKIQVELSRVATKTAA